MVEIGHPLDLFPCFKQIPILSSDVQGKAPTGRKQQRQAAVIYSAACMSPASMKPPDWRRHNAA
jgi:hypothetical protein